MSRSNFTLRFEKLVADNSPLILTAVGVAGTVATAVLTGKASIRAYEVLECERDAQLLDRRTFPRLKTKFVIQKTWKLYIPAFATGSLTIAAIIGSNRIGTRRAAALASAYAISDKAFSEYKDKVIEKIGVNKEQAVRDEIAQDRVAKLPGAREIIISGTDVLCCDMLSGRYFESSMEDLKKAQNDLNYRLLNESYASLSDFYSLVGLSSTKYSDEVGWRSDNQLELEFSTVMSEDMRPCLALNFSVEPIRDYYKVH